MPHTARLVDTAAADPVLELPPLRSVAYGLQIWPPYELRWLPDAYSSMLAFARMIAPAARSFATSVPSFGGRSFLNSVSEPSVVRRSLVSTWSLMTMGTHCSGCRTPVEANS